MLRVCQGEIVQRLAGVEMFTGLHPESISPEGGDISVIEDHGVLTLVNDLVDGGLVQTSLLRMFGLHRGVGGEAGGVGQLGVVQVVAAQTLR